MHKVEHLLKISKVVLKKCFLILQKVSILKEPSFDVEIWRVHSYSEGALRLQRQPEKLLLDSRNCNVGQF